MDLGENVMTYKLRQHKALAFWILHDISYLSALFQIQPKPKLNPKPKKQPKAIPSKNCWSIDLP